ncbi:coiled-coil domain-containing protein 103-like isoform X2 [Thrips palmi]|nr:coiled-coil domain-containing protein 103-like isoform X2 [Thrips palmi]
MAVADKEDIDFTELEKELEAAIDQDSRYWLQNDAKIRAVNQRVATYDEFRDIVKAAHLKPLKKKDIVGSSDSSSSRSGFVWNSIASGKKKAPSDRQEKHDMENDVYPRSASHQVDLQRALSSTSEFMQMWRSLDDSERRYAVLQHIGTGALGRLFSTTEIPVGLLGEILEAALHFRASTNEICFIVKMLETLTKAKRFCLTLEFLSSGEKATCKQLLSKLNSSLQGQQQDLAERGVTEWTLRQLHNAYRV